MELYILLKPPFPFHVGISVCMGPVKTYASTKGLGNPRKCDGRGRTELRIMNSGHVKVSILGNVRDSAR